MSLLRSLAAADQYFARKLAQPVARHIELLLGIDCFRLARLAALVSLCGDAVVNLSLLRWGGLGVEAGFRFETSLSFAIGIIAAGAVIVRSLQLEQEKQNFSAASSASLAFKYGRWLILAYAAFTSACFLGGVGLAVAGLIAPSLAAPQPPFTLLRFLADRFGDASFLLALYCLDLRPRGSGSKRAAVTTA